MIPFEMTLAETVAVAGTAFFAGVMRGFSGFGAALIVSPVLALIVGPRTAIPAILIVMTITSLQLVPGAWKDANWPAVLPLSAGATLGLPVGIWILVAVDPHIMRRAISAIVVVFAVLMLVGWRFKGKVGPLISGAVGVVSGLISGAAAAGGPPVVMFLLAGPESAARNRAAIILFFFLTQIAGIFIFWANGLLTARALWVAVPMIPTVLIGTWIGERLFGKASDILYRRIALGILLAIGLSTLFA